AATLTQITPSSAGDGSFAPVIDGNGDRVVFYSTADLTGGNAAHDEEIFLYTIGQNGFTQLTQLTSAGTGNNFTPTIDGDGQRIAFVRSSDPNGLHADVMLYDAGSLFQLSSAPNDSHTAVRPAISADGQHVVFASTGSPTGLNPTGSYQLFLY